MRLQPFESCERELQAGGYDSPDRLVASLQTCYSSSAEEGISDAKELVPEFYGIPAAFENRSGFSFGVQTSGAQLGAVEAVRRDVCGPGPFVLLSRSLLESPLVSYFLPRWIDLIFGCRQTGAWGERSFNIGYWVTHGGALQFELVRDFEVRQSLISQVHSFGVNPLRQFTYPHPAKRTCPDGMGWRIWEYLNAEDVFKVLPAGAFEVYPDVTSYVDAQGHAKNHPDSPSATLFDEVQDIEFLPPPPDLEEVPRILTEKAFLANFSTTGERANPTSPDPMAEPHQSVSTFAAVKNVSCVIRAKPSSIIGGTACVYLSRSVCASVTEDAMHVVVSLIRRGASGTEFTAKPEETEVEVVVPLRGRASGLYGEGDTLVVALADGICEVFRFGNGVAYPPRFLLKPAVPSAVMKDLDIPLSPATPLASAKAVFPSPRSPATQKSPSDPLSSPNAGTRVTCGLVSQFYGLIVLGLENGLLALYSLRSLSLLRHVALLGQVPARRVALSGDSCDIWVLTDSSLGAYNLSGDAIFFSGDSSAFFRHTPPRSIAAAPNKPLAIVGHVHGVISVWSCSFSKNPPRYEQATLVSHSQDISPLQGMSEGPPSPQSPGETAVLTSGPDSDSRDPVGPFETLCKPKELRGDALEYHPNYCRTIGVSPQVLVCRLVLRARERKAPDISSLKFHASGLAIILNNSLSISTPFYRLGSRGRPAEARSAAESTKSAKPKSHGEEKAAPGALTVSSPRSGTAFFAARSAGICSSCGLLGDAVCPACERPFCNACLSGRVDVRPENGVYAPERLCPSCAGAFSDQR